jgi:TatD DNase family protein
MLIDSHCHLNNIEKNQRRAILNAGPNCLFIDSSIDLFTSRESLDISNQQTNTYTSLGFHPSEIHKFAHDTIRQYQNLLDSNKKICAIGEIGLDFKSPDMHEQERIFKEFIMLAKKNNLPIAIHSRIENERTLEVLDDFYDDYTKVIFHCYSYGKETLKKITDKGGFASFSLNILRKKTEILGSLEFCPLENILLETDSPYMKINNRPSTPLDIAQVYNTACQIKNIEISKLEDVVELNSKKVFKL